MTDSCAPVTARKSTSDFKIDYLRPSEETGSASILSPGTLDPIARIFGVHVIPTVMVLLTDRPLEMEHVGFHHSRPRFLVPYQGDKGAAIRVPRTPYRSIFSRIAVAYYSQEVR
jgi:hypothetical protein